ncbi:hypothetical protein BCR44DRAFT_1426457 [Catenaria anguillulae PL171]|uniref:Uncharacterized protein n=1 Tax=Catenaria anguillulae PL171 TaxID=765915 RepID=A0A1Y2HXR7_9FUNG|nr:hypothetical protein BCR44DRAFT_1426457 [Catenaria anguillulae PL171]
MTCPDCGSMRKGAPSGICHWNEDRTSPELATVMVCCAIWLTEHSPKSTTSGNSSLVWGKGAMMGRTNEPSEVVTLSTSL